MVILYGSRMWGYPKLYLFHKKRYSTEEISLYLNISPLICLYITHAFSKLKIRSFDATHTGVACSISRESITLDIPMPPQRVRRIDRPEISATLLFTTATVGAYVVGCRRKNTHRKIYPSKKSYTKKWPIMCKCLRRTRVERRKMMFGNLRWKFPPKPDNCSWLTNYSYPPEAIFSWSERWCENIRNREWAETSGNGVWFCYLRHLSIILEDKKAKASHLVG